MKYAAFALAIARLAVVCAGFALLVYLPVSLITGSSASPAITVGEVAGELVDAGCLMPGANAAEVVAAERETGHDPWLACLFEGGTVAGCGVPCGRGPIDR